MSVFHAIIQVIFNKLYGIEPDVMKEGTHFRIPFIQEPVIMDIRDRPRTIHSATGTKDLQTVNISLRVLSRPDEDFLPGIYKQYDSMPCHAPNTGFFTHPLLPYLRLSNCASTLQVWCRLR